MEIVGLIVVLVIAICFILTVLFLIGYVIKRNKARLRNAAISFTTGIVGLSLLIVIEELFFFYNTSNKEEVLVASREAPIGGILLKLYADSTFEIGGFRQVTSTGKFELLNDTLVITSTNTIKKHEQFIWTSFLIKGDRLQEIKDTGIRFLEIHENTLKVGDASGYKCNTDVSL